MGDKPRGREIVPSLPASVRKHGKGRNGEGEIWE
jgi:hypothetical protein